MPRHGVWRSAVYDDPEEVLRREQPDFIDTATYPFTFSPLLSWAPGTRPWSLAGRLSPPAVAIAEENLNASLSRFRHTIVGWLRILA
jgi:hypothetical protein